jgi:hypothetical protein
MKATEWLARSAVRLVQLLAPVSVGLLELWTAYWAYRIAAIGRATTAAVITIAMIISTVTDSG